MTIENGLKYKRDIINLLTSAKLPADDLPGKLDDFLVMIDKGKPVAAAGMEVYGAYALLRSVVVLPDFRSKGIANILLTAVEQNAVIKNIKAIYLLTETASEYFSLKGYEPIERNTIPAEVQQSSEFSYVCPVSAIAMKKIL